VRRPEEVEEVHEVKDRSEGVAAFFDLDGTLVAGPSMERRFFRMLRWRGEIRAGNWVLWMWEAMRLSPRGIRVMLQANKMYLRGVQSFGGRGRRGGDDRPGLNADQPAQGHVTVFPRRDSRMPVPSFFAEAVERAAWHARQRHAIVLVSGTLEPLAEEAGRGLEAELAARGLETRIRVCATRLEEKVGRWTGKILGEAMFGEAKARAAMRLADEMRLDLRQCYAYGDSLHDRWLIEAVGWPAAVNPSRQLGRIARRLCWTVLRWGGGENLTQRAQRTRSSKRGANGLACDGDDKRQKQVGLGEPTQPLMKAEAMGEATSRSLG
jgi:phosphoserine phosphatase